MTPPSNLLFYSANSYLSFLVNRRFYGGQHYIWCSPVFNPTTLDELNPLRNIAVSSSPHHIYANYRDSAKSSDTHSDLIKQNKRGIKRGAAAMLAANKIDQNQYQMIMYMVKNAQLSDFRPMLYLIPAHLVAGKLNVVPPREAANPLGPEYRIFDLMDNEFDAIEFKN
jgi:hypothetical protein